MTTRLLTSGATAGAAKSAASLEQRGGHQPHGVEEQLDEEDAEEPGAEVALVGPQDRDRSPPR